MESVHNGKVVKTLKLDLGVISYWYGRLGVQANKIMIGTIYLITIYEMIQVNTLAVFLLPLGLAGLAVLGFIDNNKAIEGELAYWFKRNPEFRKMVARQKKIIKLLEDKC